MFLSATFLGEVHGLTPDPSSLAYDATFETARADLEKLAVSA